MDPVPSRGKTICIVVSAIVGAVLAGVIGYCTSENSFTGPVVCFMFVAAVIGGHFARVIYNIIHEDPRPKPPK